jgi:D-serine deaminase-like pyridoxal phosphate-dependent protein
MTTQKQIWAAKSDRRMAWASAAEARAADLLASRNTDHAFMTQPGHIPARAAEIARSDRAFALMQKAADHRAKAVNLASLANRNKGDAETARQAVRDARSYEAGDAVVSVHYGAATVVKVNAKSVRIRTASGFVTTQDKSFVKAV